jgi:hypothetical protein
MEDGETFGFIYAVDVAKRTITFDVGSFVEGDRAEEIARSDGEIEKGEELDNDYYIRNRVNYARTLRLASDARLRVVGDPPDLVDGDLDDFAAAFDDDEVQPFGDGPSYRGKQGSYWVTLDDGEVVRIEEQYVP